MPIQTTTLFYGVFAGQDYEDMVSLVEGLQAVQSRFTDTTAIQYLFAFALNRRKNKGDSDKALVVIKRVSGDADKALVVIKRVSGRTKY